MNAGGRRTPVELVPASHAFKIDAEQEHPGMQPSGGGTKVLWVVFEGTGPDAHLLRVLQRHGFRAETLAVEDLLAPSGRGARRIHGRGPRRISSSWTDRAPPMEWNSISVCDGG